MSFTLHLGSKPAGTEMATRASGAGAPPELNYGTGGSVLIGKEVELSMLHFLRFVHSAMRTYPIQPNDVRWQFINAVCALEECPGFGDPVRLHAIRLAGAVAPILPEHHVQCGVLVPFNRFEISMSDLMFATYYALTNSNIEGRVDPRLIFVASMKTGKRNGDHLTFPYPFDV